MIAPVPPKLGSDFHFKDLSNSISNQPLLAKILEQTISEQHTNHMSIRHLLEPFQSGFRTSHSSETALDWVTNDFLMSADSGAIRLMILLDPSAVLESESSPLS